MYPHIWLQGRGTVHSHETVSSLTATSCSFLQNPVHILPTVAALELVSTCPPPMLAIHYGPCFFQFVPQPDMQDSQGLERQGESALRLEHSASGKGFSSVEEAGHQRT